jgi:hypothetical protein
MLGGGVFLVVLASVFAILANRNYRQNASPRKKVDTVGNFLIFGTLFCAGMSVFMGRTRRRTMIGKLPAAPIDSSIFDLSSLLLVAIFVITVVNGAARGTFPHYSIRMRAVALGLAVLAARKQYRTVLRWRSGVNLMMWHM